MSYKKVGWQDSPSSSTPILSVSLNQMDDGIDKANKGIVFGYSATFTADNVFKNTTQTEALGTGSFSTGQTDIVTVFVADNVTKINSGTFSGCTSLKTIYIDNTVGNVDIVSGAVPSGVSIVYSDDENFINVNELLASAIKSLKVQANTDRQNFNKSVDEINTKLETKENISNKVSVITHPSLDYYPDTKAVFDYVNSKLETPLSDIESLKADKLDKTDFNTYKTATDKAVANNSALLIKNQINVTTEKSTSVVVNDSSDCNIVNLICDDTDDSKQIAFYRKNLLDFNNIRVNANDSASNIVVNKDSKSISFTTSETGANSGVYIRHNNYSDFKGYGVDYTKLGGKPVALSLDVQSDINCRIAVQFIKTSYKYFDITSEKQRIVVTDTVDVNKLNKALCFYTNKTKANITISNIQIEVNNTATDYEDCDCQKVTLADVDVNSLHTYYPSTTVISDSDFILNYIADPKNYIDNKFNELATAIVAHESEVN